MPRLWLPPSEPPDQQHQPTSAMPSISEVITIPAPLSVVWPLLSDPARVAACIPGATLSPDQENGVWKGSIRVKFGPTVAVFRGEATLTYDHAAHECRIEGRGIDQRGASRALASGLVQAKGDAATTLAIEGEYSVTGPLETFANAGGVHVARALLAEFSSNMARLVAEEQGAAAAPASADATPIEAAAAAADPATSTETAAPAASSTPARAPNPPAPAAELSAFAILWAAFKSWLSTLIGKRN